MKSRHVVAPVVLSAVATLSIADVLFTNGQIITNPTGGTGSIAGLPLSNADGYNVPGSTFLFSTTGTSASISDGTTVAENFVVTGAGWRIDSATFFAFQTSQTTATVTNVRLNLWTAKPYAADSPDLPVPPPSPMPAPLLATPINVAAGPGTFVCHRESPSSTSTVRPVFSYTVPLGGLLPGGVGSVLPPGEYWLEWSFTGAASPSPRVFIPLVPRVNAFDFGARLYNAVSGVSTDPRTWFEGREGFVAGAADGRAYALAFQINGTPYCPADFDGSGGTPDAADIGAFFDAWLAGDPSADTDLSGGTPDAGDVDRFFAFWLAGGC